MKTNAFQYSEKDIWAVNKAIDKGLKEMGLENILVTQQNGGILERFKSLEIDLVQMASYFEENGNSRCVSSVNGLLPLYKLLKVVDPGADLELTIYKFGEEKSADFSWGKFSSSNYQLTEKTIRELINVLEGTEFQDMVKEVEVAFAFSQEEADKRFLTLFKKMYPCFASFQKDIGRNLMNEVEELIVRKKKEITGEKLEIK